MDVQQPGIGNIEFLPSHFTRIKAKNLCNSLILLFENQKIILIQLFGEEVFALLFHFYVDLLSIVVQVFSVLSNGNIFFEVSLGTEFGPCAVYQNFFALGDDFLPKEHLLRLLQIFETRIGILVNVAYSVVG